MAFALSGMSAGLQGGIRCAPAGEDGRGEGDAGGLEGVMAEAVRAVWDLWGSDLGEGGGRSCGFACAGRAARDHKFKVDAWVM